MIAQSRGVRQMCARTVQQALPERLEAALGRAARAGRWLLLGATLLLGGCASIEFYGQAVAGQLRLLTSRDGVNRLLAREDLEASLRARLELSQRILSYAEAELALDADGSYRSYARVPGTSIVWNVVAAPPDSVVPLSWCFPVAGCVSYRGYFNQARAQRAAERFARRGFDTYVAGAAAYSTLGWFNDPLLSTFIHWPQPALAELLFHELAHGEFYLPGDTAFNESFATFVARRALGDWLDGANKAERAEFARHRARQAERARFTDLLLRLRAALAEDFAAVETPADALAARARRYDEAGRCYRRVRESFSDDRYDRYFEQPPNMARLALLGAYNGWVGAFAALYRDNPRWPDFYDAVRQLGALENDARQARLQELLDAGASRARDSEQQVEQAADDDGAEQIHCEALASHAFDGDAAAAEDDDVGGRGDGEHEGAGGR